MERCNSIITKYDAYFLKPQWLAYAALIIICLIKHEWFYTAVLLFLEIVISVAGATLYPNRNYNQLAQGTLPKRGDIIYDKLSSEDSFHLAKAVRMLSLAFGLAVFAALLHNGTRWWFALLLALVAVFIYAIVPFLVLSVFRHKKKNNA